jgi:phosphatidylserine/phosphatidylglycerophosphate/cardiolipin synthase-like enzyme
MSDGPSIRDPLNPSPPSKLMGRKIVVRPGQVNTVRLMHDPKDTDRNKWFVAGERAIRDGNEVTYLIRGEETFAAMAEAIGQAANFSRADPTNNKGIVYLLGWDCQLDTPMVPGTPASTFHDLLRHASACGVEIRAMLWANTSDDPTKLDRFSTAPAVVAINALPTGRAILDAKTSPILNLPGGPEPARLLRGVHRGAHHQKVLITHSDLGLIAFCGGLDINKNRLEVDRTGLQDVHCRIKGPAANDLLVLFANRWDDYLNAVDPAPDHDLLPPRDATGARDRSKDFLSARLIPSPRRSGKQIVQIGRTTPKGLYPRFRPAGEQSARKMILHAIRAASTFIYMEDQYLLNLECADALAEAAAKPGMRFVSIVVPSDENLDAEFLGVGSFHRDEFVRRLRASSGQRKISIHIASDRFVHSKIYIFDDKYAIIGSANANRRGWESDSEVVAGIFDESSNSEATMHFARRLRMKLWADRLNLAARGSSANRAENSQEEYAELADAVASAAHWRKRPPAAFWSPRVPIDHKGETPTQVVERNLKRLDKYGLSERFRHQISLLKKLGLVGESLFWDMILDPPEAP